MRTFAPIVALLAVLLAAVTARSEEVVVASGIRGPEGPLFVDGNLYYVGWVDSALYRWDGKVSTILNNSKPCGHNGLALTPRRTFLVACGDEPSAILELDMKGKELRRWTTDKARHGFAGGVNDIVVTAKGGAYATLYGPFGGDPTLVEGKIIYLAPGAMGWIEVADDLNYANGIGVSPDGGTLYVSETVSNCILKFTINPDGALSRRSNFVLLNRLTPNRNTSWWLGPDSMKIDRRGDIYVAQAFGAKVLKISPTGSLLHVFDIAAGENTTNVAFGPDEKDLYITVVKDGNDPEAKGVVVRIPNVD